MDGCSWCLINDKMKQYHDKEWGVPVHDDQKQFEFLMMEVMQCGLNWNMMLKKRDVFRACFDGFNYDKVASYTDVDVDRIMNTEGMIRSFRKINAVIHNAKCFQTVRKEFGSFSEYIWSYTDGKMILYSGHEKGILPAKNGLSDTIAKDLKKRGFKYLGSVTVYAHLQASGMINDHNKDCEQYHKLINMYPTITKRRYKEE
ncbi:MAG: DNA-3-methyladenine glycosylase I [Lachnospiraceae bacterium]|nr:DNA-3-methyladenine glycosylase I [Lachnospiraceae bacterium]